MSLTDGRLNNCVTKLLFVPDQYITQKCDNVVNNYPDALESIPDCFKTQKLSKNAASNYPSTIQFVLDQFKTHEICDKAFHTYPFVFILLLVRV